MERAARSLDLMVTVDIALTETAALSHYVLPAASQYEKWEFTAFNFEFPTNYFHLRAPLFEPLPGTLPECEIYSLLLRAMGELPPEDQLVKLGEIGRVIARNFRRSFLECCSLAQRSVKWPPWSCMRPLVGRRGWVRSHRSAVGGVSPAGRQGAAGGARRGDRRRRVRPW
jgi:anaerobic selenocysteine-containing dehydrogenase